VPSPLRADLHAGVLSPPAHSRKTWAKRTYFADPSKRRKTVELGERGAFEGLSEGTPGARSIFTGVSVRRLKGCPSYTRRGEKAEGKRMYINALTDKGNWNLSQQRSMKRFHFNGRAKGVQEDHRKAAPGLPFAGVHFLFQKAQKKTLVSPRRGSQGFARWDIAPEATRKTARLTNRREESEWSKSSFSPRFSCPLCGDLGRKDQPECVQIGRCDFNSL